MQASIVDLRYHMKDILKAIDRNEKIDILYHGIKKAVMIPVSEKRDDCNEDLTKHPFFGMLKDDSRSVGDVMSELRRNRYDDI